LHACVPLQTEVFVPSSTQVAVPAEQVTVPVVQPAVVQADPQHCPAVQVAPVAALQTAPSGATVVGLLAMQVPVPSWQTIPWVQDEVTQAAQVAPVAALQTVPAAAGTPVSTQETGTAQLIVPASHGLALGTQAWLLQVAVQTPLRQKLPPPQSVPSGRNAPGEHTGPLAPQDVTVQVAFGSMHALAYVGEQLLPTTHATHAGGVALLQYSVPVPQLAPGCL
jgi:hypothetical protein